MLYFTYILYSKAIDKYYVGSTQDIDKRLAKHLTNHKGFTSRAKDWKVVYYETFVSKLESLRRERQIKGCKSRKMIVALFSKDS